MGGGLAGDIHALGLGLADDFDALLCGDVADVIAAAGFPCQLDVPGDLAPLAFRADAGKAVGAGVFAVVDAAAAQQRIDLAVGGDSFKIVFTDPRGRGFCTAGNGLFFEEMLALRYDQFVNSHPAVRSVVPFLCVCVVCQ